MKNRIIIRLLLATIFCVACVVAVVIFLAFSQPMSTALKPKPANPQKVVSVLSCNSVALPQGYVGPAPKVECTTNQEQKERSGVGLAWISSNSSSLAKSFARQFPDMPALNFVDSGKPFCVVMLTDYNKKVTKAQCFDTEKDLEDTAKVWRSMIIS